MMLFYLLLVIVFIILLVIFDRSKSKILKKTHEELGCDYLYLPIIGHCHILFGGERRIRNYLDIAKQCYKNKHGMISFWFVNYLFVGISDPVQAKIVLKSCLNKGELGRLASSVLGHSSAFAPVEEWRHRRKIMGAVLAPRFVKDFIEIFSRHSEETCYKLRSEVSKGDFSIWEYFFGFSVDLISETSTGINTNTKSKDHHPVLMALEQSMENLISRVTQPWHHVDAIYKLSSIYRRQAKNIKMLEEFTAEIISKKKKMMEEKLTNVQDTEASKKTFYELMIEISRGNNGYSEKELLEEVMLLVTAAADTTTSMAGFICLMLSLYPDVQEKAYEEIQKVLGDSTTALNIEHLEKLEYTEAVIKEVIRLYPPGPAILRESKEDVELPSGFKLYKGTYYFINIIGINRNPRYWGTDAEEFRPERFLEGAPTHPAAFMSFSNGPRNCAGQYFAMMTLKILTINILKCYRLKPATCYEGEKDVKFSVNIMLRPINEYKVKIEPRS